MATKYLSLYFCLKYDSHREQQTKMNNFGYIQEYYESIIKHRLDCIIIYDAMNDEFIKKYSNENIKFYKQLSMNDMCIHDGRFIYFLEYIQNNKDTKYFLLSDISDVVIINPIEKIIDINDEILYVSKENQNILDNEWFSNKFTKHKTINDYKKISDYKNIFDNKVMLNCGVIFGHRNILIEFLTHFVTLLIDIYKYHNDDISYPLDMFVVNYTSYKYFNSRLYDGELLTTIFGSNIYDTTKCIKHK